MTSNHSSSDAPKSEAAAFGSSHANIYAEGPPRQVPGFAGLHRMTSMLLAERVPANGRILVLGAGGGLELKALAEDHSGWTFDGVDPSADMLRVAEQIVGRMPRACAFIRALSTRHLTGRSMARFVFDNAFRAARPAARNAPSDPPPPRARRALRCRSHQLRTDRA